MHTGTSSPLSFFSFTNPAVRLRHLASTTAPLFSRLTEGCRHRFFRLVRPSPRKSSLWPSCSSRYFISAFNSASAFSISDIVPTPGVRFPLGSSSGSTHVSNRSACDVLDNTADKRRSGTRETRSFLSQRASQARSDLRHRAFLRMIMSRGQLTLWNTLTLEIAHITSNKTIMSSLLIKESG